MNLRQGIWKFGLDETKIILIGLLAPNALYGNQPDQ